MALKKVPIIVAYGVEFRDLSHRTALENELKALTGSPGPDHWVYRRGGKEYDIRIVFTKAAFAAALDTPGAIVIYDGHARFGQGPAFSDRAAPKCPADLTAFPDNPWENHFRMGYDIVSVPCVEDILTHGTHPAEHGALKAPGFISGSVAAIFKKATAKGTCAAKPFYDRRRLMKCAPAVAGLANCRGVKSLEKRYYWYRTIDPDTDDPDYHTLVKVGAADLAKVRLRCKVLVLNSCSSKPRFYAPLLRHKKKVKSDCVFYLTRRTAYLALTEQTNIFVRMVLAGAEPTQKKDAARLVKAVNAVNPGIFRSSGIKHATGILELVW